MLATVIALLFLAAACGSDDDETLDEPTSAQGDAETDGENDAGNDAETDGDEAATEEPADETVDDGADLASELFPDVLDAVATHDGDGSWTFSATLSSPYDSAARYADAWRVLGPDDEVYGVRELTHDHASEQPFTRSQSGIEIPEDVTTVIVQGRDQVSGWGGATVEVELAR